MRLIDWWLQKVVDFNQKDERCFVDNPRRARWLHIRLMAGLALAVVLMAYLAREMSGSWLNTLVAMTAGCLMGGRLMNAHLRASAYRTGWLRGRSAMLSSMKEAQERGMDAQDWLDAEYERDSRTLGF